MRLSPVLLPPLVPCAAASLGEGFVEEEAHGLQAAGLGRHVQMRAGGTRVADDDGRAVADAGAEVELQGPDMASVRGCGRNCS